MSKRPRREGGEKRALRALGLTETNRDAVRTTYLADSSRKVYRCSANPLSPKSIAETPPKNDSTLLLDQETDDGFVKEWEELKHKVSILQEQIEQRNFSLYERIYSTREMVLTSLLKEIGTKLNKHITLAINQETARARVRDSNVFEVCREKDRQGSFSYKKALLVLQSQKEPVKTKLMEMMHIAESSLLTDYRRVGVDCGKVGSEQIQRAIRIYSGKILLARNAGSHTFEFPGSNNREEDGLKVEVQENILKDILKAMDKGWLTSDFEVCKEVLLLEVQQRMSEGNYDLNEN